MYVRRYLVFVALTIGGLLAGTAPPLSQAQAARTNSIYVEPALSVSTQDRHSVIVSGVHAGDAQRAVTQVGGQITSNLTIIDAVAATISTAQLRALTRMPHISSIVNNKGVTSSNGNGWVTDIRILKASYAAGDTLTTQPVYLPDGGFVAYSTNGKLLIINADGTERARATLPGGGPFTSPPLVGADGTSYVAGQSLRVLAFTPAGVMRWQFAIGGSNKFLGGVVMSPDGTTVYAAHSGRTVYALDAATGSMRWQFTAASTITGSITTNPTIGADGMLYFTTDKGWIVAINTNGTQRWAYNTATDLTVSPTIAPNGILYAVSVGTKRLFAINTTTGSLVFSKTFSGTPRNQVVAGPDGSVYVATEPTLFAFNANGTQRFSFTASGGLFKTKPVLASDTFTLYIAVAGKNLFAIDTQTGAQRWMYTLSGNMADSPALDSEGGVVVGSDLSELVRLGPDGTLTSRFTTSATVSQAASASRINSDVTVRVGTSSLMTIGRMPDRWDGRKDVVATNNKTIYQLVNPESIDIGADVLHKTQLNTSSKIRGLGVTIAVVDSGIYFDKDVRTAMGGRINQSFLGQPDYVDPICAVNPDGTLAGIQYSDYCLTDKNSSRDSFGHGTHVAGILWNDRTDQATGVYMGIAPEANMLGVRVLDGNGTGSYERVIKGIEYVINNRATYNVRVLNLSLSAPATVPYFVDPLNRAVEKAWASGIVVLAAAGNTGPTAQTVTVPGNDPYVITVGAISENRTPGYWADDFIPSWSASGPTADGFVKPDVLAPGSNIVSFMWNGGNGDPNTQALAKMHPEFSSTLSMFRMSGTSMATAVASGVAALMMQVNPNLTPDQVKYRLMETARPAVADGNALVYSPLQQGSGRIWAPDAVLGNFSADAKANQGMDINADLAHGYATDADLSYHYQGTIQRSLSDDGQAYLYYYQDAQGNAVGLGVSRVDTKNWIDLATLASGRMTWSVGRMTWSVANNWDGGLSLASGRMTWSVGRMTWSVGRMTWSVGRMTWSVGRMTWSVNTTWPSSSDPSASAVNQWSTSSSLQSNIISSTTWVDDE